MQTILLCMVGAASLSALLTFIASVYARRRQLLDLPGRRRSHVFATPRGGGIGIVLTVLVATLWLGIAGALPIGAAVAFALGLLCVASVGWLDDHRPLSARARLVVHFLASGLLVSQLPDSAQHADPWLSALRLGLQLILLATAINFWNFMDGIDGLITTQSAWVAVCALIGFGLAGAGAWALLAAVLAGACLGFLPYNFPRARIFLGDVGSGGLGFACGALLLLGESMNALTAWSALMIASAVLLDAGITLASRMLRRRRWYHAHREHLYQWLVRVGHSHVQTTWLYLLWNLILVLPLLWLSHANPDAAPLFGFAVLVAGAVVWSLGKRAVLDRVKTGRVD